MINHAIECLNFNQMLITLSGLLIGFAVVFGSAAPLFADYILILKNGRTINVKAYKEEGDVIILSSYCGEISIAKEDVQSIIPAVEGLATRQVSPQADVVPGGPPEIGLGEEKLARPGRDQGMEGMKDEPLATKEKVLTPEEIEAEERAKEEKEYQEMYKDIPRQFKSRTELRWLMTKGTTNPDPTLIESLKILNARIDDINSRMKDSQHNPTRSRGTGIVNLEVGSPFGGGRMTIGLRHGGKIVPGKVIAHKLDLARPGRTYFPKLVSHYKQMVDVPLPTYSHREKYLSELREQLIQIYDERLKLIQEMKDKGMFTGSLPGVPRKFME